MTVLMVIQADLVVAIQGVRATANPNEQPVRKLPIGLKLFEAR